MQEEMDAIQAPAENNIAGTGSVTAHTARGTVHCITIVGQIEGHMELPAQNKTTKYEHLIPQIAAAEQAEEIDGMLVLLNTVGGDVGGRACHCRADRGHDQAHGLARAGRRAFDRRAARRGGQKELYRRLRRHGPSIRLRMNGTIIAVPQAFEYLAKIQRAHRGLHHRPLRDLGRAPAAAHARDRPAHRGTWVP